MKNKDERIAFLNDYHKWAPGGNYAEVNHSDWKMQLRFYCHTFKNGAMVIATECEQKNRTNEINLRYNLIIPAGDNYNPYDQNSGHTSADFQSYTLEGVGISTIVDYMTKRRDVI